MGAALWKTGANANFGAAALLGAVGTVVYFFTHGDSGGLSRESG
jgi:hypothetical protein